MSFELLFAPGAQLKPNGLPEWSRSCLTNASKPAASSKALWPGADHIRVRQPPYFHYLHTVLAAGNAPRGRALLRYFDLNHFTSGRAACDIFLLVKMASSVRHPKYPVPISHQVGRPRRWYFEMPPSPVS